MSPRHLAMQEEAKSHQGMDTCFLRANTLGDVSRVTSRQVSISANCSVTNLSQTFLDNLQNGRTRGSWRKPFLLVQTSDYEEDAYVCISPHFCLCRRLTSQDRRENKQAKLKASQIFPFLKGSLCMWWFG